jgi:hypothetical protein
MTHTETVAETKPEPELKPKKAKSFFKGMNKLFDQVKTNLPKGVTNLIPVKELQVDKKTLKQRFITFDEERLIVLRDLE